MTSPIKNKKSKTGKTKIPEKHQRCKCLGGESIPC